MATTADEAALSIVFEDIDPIKRLFAFKELFSNNEATLSLFKCQVLK
jgi:hypothetical protein